MRTIRAGRGSGAIGAVGVTIVAIDDFIRFFVASPLVGSAPAVITAVSVVLLLVGGVLCWRGDQLVSWALGALALQVFGRLAVSEEPAALYWAVSVVHLLCPVIASIIGVAVGRRVGPVGVRRVGLVAGIAAGCWLVTSWTPVPLPLVPLARAVTDGCLLTVLAWPALVGFGKASRRIWDSAEVR